MFDKSAQNTFYSYLRDARCNLLLSAARENCKFARINRERVGGTEIEGERGEMEEGGKKREKDARSYIDTLSRSSGDEERQKHLLRFIHTSRRGGA